MKAKVIFLLMAMALTNQAMAATNVVKIGAGVTLNSSKYENRFYEGTSYQTNKNFKKSSFYVAFAKIEHGISFVPNYLIESKTLKLESSNTSDTTKIKHISNVLYCSFELAVIELQLGAIQDGFDIENLPEKSSTGLYSKLIIDAPMLPVTPSITYSKGSGDDNVESLALNIAFNLMPGIYLDLGTKSITYNYLSDGTGFKDKKLYTKTDGLAYLGISFNLVL